MCIYSSLFSIIQMTVIASGPSLHITVLGPRACQGSDTTTVLRSPHHLETEMSGTGPAADWSNTT